jgi:Putative adhesin
MKKRTTVLALALMITGFVQAQEFKISKTSGRLELNVGRVTVEGHDGNEIIFTSTNGKSEKDERAEGLRLVNSLGLEDNTGLGINVTDKGNVVEVNQLKQTHSPDIKVLVPKGVIVSFKFESQYGGKARFVNMTNEIEVSAQYNSVELDQVTGPVTVETTYGSVTANFNSPIKDPVSIVSIYGFIDITLPQTVKANLKMSTSYGDIFVAPDFKIEVPTRDGMKVYGDQITGTLNGGGVNVNLDCNYGKIYVRKK